MTDHSTVRLLIDVKALRHNYRFLQSLSPEASVAAVVKADAYGLGLNGVVRALHSGGCEDFFVANLTEALAVRGITQTANIYVLEGVSADPKLALTQRLTPVLNTWEEWQQWREWDPQGLWLLQLDTGIGRAGIDESSWCDALTPLDVLNQHERVCLLTQWAVAEEPAHPLNAWQLACLTRMRAKVPRARVSTANSAGMFLGPEFQGDLARPGLALYGGQPTARAIADIQPVVRLEAKVLQLKTVAQAQPIGYGATHYLTPGDTVATLGVGYADGLARERADFAYVLAHGVRCPVVGRISMDLLTVQLPAALKARVRVGEWMTLLGDSQAESISLEQLARMCRRSTHSLLTGFHAAVERIYID
jgi:alanine racemase